MTTTTTETTTTQQQKIDAMTRLHEAEVQLAHARLTLRSVTLETGSLVAAGLTREDAHMMQDRLSALESEIFDLSLRVQERYSAAVYALRYDE